MIPGAQRSSVAPAVSECRPGGGAADDADAAVVELDSQGGLGDQHGGGLVLVDAGEGDLLPDG
jgi:hypothetical protein